MIPLLRWFFPIKNVAGDADASPGCAPSLLFLTGPESKEKKLILSSSSKSRSPSPKMIVSSPRQSPRVVSFVESSDNLAPPSSNLMEKYDAKRSTDGQSTIMEIVLKQSGGGSGSKNVVVIVDATREFSLTALMWAFSNVVKAGDVITLLGILHQVQNPSTLSLKLAIHTGMSQLLGYKQKADVSAFVGTNRKQLDEEISRKLEILRNACMDPVIHGVCDQNGIKLEVKIVAGPSTKTVASRCAADLQASWVILDRAMKKDKKHLMEHLDCNLVLMKRNGGEIIRLNQPILDDEYVSDSILYELTPTATDDHFLDNLEIERSKDEENILYSGSPPQFGYQFSPQDSVYLRSGASSSFRVDPSKSETTASDVDSGSETVDMKAVNSYDNLMLATTSDPTSDSEATCDTVVGTSDGDNQLGIDRSVGTLSTMSGSASFYDFSGALSSSAASLDCSDGYAEQSLTPTKDSMFGTDLATDLRGQMSNVIASEENSGSAEISPRNTSATTFNKDWTPKSQSVVESTDSPRPYQSVYSISPSSSRPPSSQGRVSANPISTLSADALNVYHPKPLSAKKHLELNDLLNKSGSYSDRTAVTVRVRDVDTFAGSESRQISAPKTPPIDIAIVKSKTPIEGVVHDESKSATPPSISSLVLTSGREIDRLKKYSLQSEEEEDSYTEFDPNASMRGYMFMSLKRYSTGAPPLCSICNHKSPEFGRPPRKFTYAELEVATNNFSSENFLAEGGYGFVYKGVLKEGQAVAVKQHKLASSQGDMEFCSEVEVLSCAQHRNLVTLIGYCVENRRRLLVYEFVCNGSLDWHLSYRNPNVLEWQARQKIAVGAARGLRYLHEECRVGCIVHRDMRPNNILLTHDFQPMVGDFGLARWQPSGDTAVETRVIGTLGYLAPEYAETGQITEKADVFSFGVVLLELITGRKAIDPSRSRGEQCLTEWARPKLEERATHELLDPRLEAFYDDYELYCMVFAASLCIRKEPLMRPKMNQVLRILEGDNTTGGSSPLRGTFSRTPSTEAFTSIACSSMGRMDALDLPYNFQSRTSDPTSIPTTNSNSKSDREHFISHSAPLTGTTSRNSKSSTDEKNVGEKVYPLGGSRSLSAKPGTSPKAWSPNKLSYNQML